MKRQRNMTQQKADPNVKGKNGNSDRKSLLRFKESYCFKESYSMSVEERTRLNVSGVICR